MGRRGERIRILLRRLEIPPRNKLWGLTEFHLHVTARPDAQRRDAAVGRAGTTIVDSITELEEFDHAPWTTGQVGGEVIFEALEQTSGRRAILRAVMYFRSSWTPSRTASRWSSGLQSERHETSIWPAQAAFPTRCGASSHGRCANCRAWTI